jgi:hypothetical protein
MSYQMKLVKGIKGVNESVDPELLQDGVLTAMENMVLDVIEGVPTARQRFKPYGSSQAGAIQSLDEVSVNGVDYLLSCINGTLYKSQNGIGSWTAVKTGLNTAARLRTASFNQQVICTNGVDPLFITDLVNNFNLSLPRPDVTGITITTSATGGNMTDQSNYMYVFVFMASDGSLGIPSQPFLGFGGASYTTAGGGSNQSSVILSGLPTTTDPRIGQLWIFRTEANKMDFFFLASLPIGTTTFTDTFADTALDLATTLQIVNTPNSALYILVHKDRVFLANITKTPATFPTYPYVQENPSNPNAYLLPIQYNSATGLTPNSAYQYGVTYVLADGTETAMSLGPIFTSAASPNLGAQVQVAMPLVPSAPGSNTYVAGNPSITAMKLYRTKAGGGTFYLLHTFQSADWIPLVNASLYPKPLVGYNDTADDSTLTQSYTGLATLTLNSAIIWSEAEQIQQFNDLNIQNVSPDDGDPITGIIDDNDGILIFKQSSIFKLYTTGVQPSGLFKVVPNIGCDQPNSLIGISGQTFFASKNQLYVYANGMVDPMPISQNLRNTFNSITSWNSVTFSEVYQYVIWDVSIGTDNYLLILDLKSKDFARWYKWKVTPGSFILERQIGNDKGLLIIAGNDGGTTKLGVLDTSGATTTDSWSSLNYIPIQRVKTKTFSDGGVGLMRPRKFWLNRDKNGLSFTCYLESPDNNAVASILDSGLLNATDTFKQITDGMTNPIYIANRLFFDFIGSGLTAFRSLLFEYTPIQRGSRA